MVAVKQNASALSLRDARLKILMRDFGYSFNDGYIIQKGVRGFSSDRIWKRARSWFDAAEQLAPIIRDKEYTSRLVKITSEQNPVGKQNSYIRYRIKSLGLDGMTLKESGDNYIKVALRVAKDYGVPVSDVMIEPKDSRINPEKKTKRKSFKYKGFGIKENADGEFDIYTPDEMEQPANMRYVDMTVSTVAQAKDFIDSYNENPMKENPHGFLIVDQHLNLKGRSADYDKLQDKVDRHNEEFDDQWFVIDADDYKELKKEKNPQRSREIKDKSYRVTVFFRDGTQSSLTSQNLDYCYDLAYRQLRKPTTKAVEITFGKKLIERFDYNKNPYASKSQARLFHAKAERGEIPESVVNEYDRATDFSKLPEKVSNPDWDIDAAEYIKSRINAPFVKVSGSSLGGSDLFINLSLQPREEWENGIYHNSPNAMFVIDPQKHSLELYSKHYKLGKFRKTKYKSFDDIANKVNKYIAENSNVKNSIADLKQVNNGGASVVRAFIYGQAKKDGDDQSTGDKLSYRGNVIAERRSDGIWITDAGWATSTTKDRLNQLPSVRINAKNFQWYLNGKAWNGEWVNLDSWNESAQNPKQKKFHWEKPFKVHNQTMSVGWLGDLQVANITHKGSTYQVKVRANRGAVDLGVFRSLEKAKAVAEAHFENPNYKHNPTEGDFKAHVINGVLPKEILNLPKASGNKLRDLKKKYLEKREEAYEKLVRAGGGRMAEPMQDLLKRMHGTKEVNVYHILDRSVAAIDHEIYRRWGLDYVPSHAIKYRNNDSKGDFKNPAGIYKYFHKKGFKYIELTTGQDGSGETVYVLQWETEKPNARGWKNIGQETFKTQAAALEYVRKLTVTKAMRNHSASDFNTHVKKTINQISEMFQGEKNGVSKRVLAPESMPNISSRLGYLVQMKIKNGVGGVDTINFDGDAFLVADHRKNLWAIGKDAVIKNISRARNGMKLLGDLIQIDYVTAKKHIENGQTVRFWHKLGEVNKQNPKAYIDADGFPIIVGGGYDVWEVGIVN